MKRIHIHPFASSLIFVCLLGLLAAHAPALGQGIDVRPLRTQKLALGVYNHLNGWLPTVALEFRLAPRLSLEPSVGFADRRRPRVGVPLSQASRQYKFALGLELKHYVLFNGRNPLEGLYVAATTSYFRSAIYAQPFEQPMVGNHHWKAGLGIGGNYYVYKRWSVGAAGYLNRMTDRSKYYGNDGFVFYTNRWDRWRLNWFVQVGISMGQAKGKN